MQKTRVVEEVFRMRFNEVYDKFKKKKLSCEEAAEILGVSLKTFYRKRQIYEKEDFQGVFDGRIGKVSPHKTADEEVRFLTKFYASKYLSFNVKHFYSQIKKSHDFKRSYTKYFIEPKMCTLKWALVLRLKGFVEF